jgi:hypothetical protein
MAAVVSSLISERIVSQFLKIVDDVDKMSRRMERGRLSNNVEQT